MKPSSRYSLVFITLFLGLLLAQVFPLSQSLSSHFDRFPLHDTFVSAVTEFRLALGDRVFYDALVGPDGWLVFATNQSMDKFQNANPLSEKELDAYEKSLLKFQSLVEASGGKLLFVAAPYKNTVYPEKVPAEIQRVGSASRLDQILNRIETRTSIQVLDLRPALLEAKKGAQIYYATDTHWNDLGAFVAYRAIIEALQPSFPELNPHLLSEYKVSSQLSKQMDLAYIIGSTSLTEERVQFEPLFTQTARINSMVLPSGREVTFARNKNADLPSALFFHDSFLYSAMQFMSENFSRTYYVDMQAGNDMLPSAWVEQLRPDVVVIVLNEHFLDLLPELLSKGRSGLP